MWKETYTFEKRQIGENVLKSEIFVERWIAYLSANAGMRQNGLDF